MGPNPNANRLYKAPTKARVFQRLSYGNRRRFDANGNNSGANRFLFGGQSGMGIRLRGQGRIRGSMSQLKFHLYNNLFESNIRTSISTSHTWLFK